MKNSIKNLFLKYKKSTAQIIHNELINKGILQKNITSRDIKNLYNTLKIISSMPDFSRIRNILQNPTTKINKSLPILGVIVETRKHPDLSFVINNFLDNTHVPVQLFHGKDNLNYIMSTSISKLINDKKVYLTQLEINNLSSNLYNALFLSKEFWNNLISKNKILVFQTDAIICSHSNYSINDFISFDYIGSKWPRNRPVGLIMDGGNGGLSLRDWKKSYDCLNRFPSKYWVGGEDGYFAFHIDLIGGKVARNNECAKFSTQEEFLFKSWGAHQVSCLNKKEQLNFIEYCEEAKFLIDL